MEKDSEFEHVKMKGHRNSVLALDHEAFREMEAKNLQCFQSLKRSIYMG